MSSSKFCPGCGAELKPGSSFCPSCGRDLSGGKQAPRSRGGFESRQLGEDLKGLAASARSSVLLSEAILSGLQVAAVVLVLALAITYLGPISAVSVVNLWDPEAPARVIEPTGLGGIAINSGLIVLSPLSADYGVSTPSIRLAGLALALVPILAAFAFARRRYPRVSSESPGHQLVWALGIGLSFALIMLAVTAVWGNSWDVDGDSLGVNPLSVFFLSLLWGSLGALLGTTRAMRDHGVDPYFGLPTSVRSGLRNVLPSVVPSVQAFVAALVALSVIGSTIWVVQVIRNEEGATGFRSQAAAVLDSLAYSGDLGLRYFALGTGASLDAPSDSAENLNSGGVFDEFDEQDVDELAVYSLVFSSSIPYLASGNGNSSPIPVKSGVERFEEQDSLDGQNLFSVNDSALFRFDSFETGTIVNGEFKLYDDLNGILVGTNADDPMYRVAGIQKTLPDDFSSTSDYVEAEAEQLSSASPYNAFDYEDFLGRLYLPFLIIIFAIPGLLALYAGYSVGRTRVDRSRTSLLAWGASVGPVWALLALAGQVLSENIVFGQLDGESLVLHTLIGGAVLGALGAMVTARPESTSANS